MDNNQNPNENIMAQNSRIGWTHHTQNFWWGCNRVSAECAHCYIEPIMKRGGRSPFNGPMRTKDWKKPAKWKSKPARNPATRNDKWNYFQPFVRGRFVPSPGEMEVGNLSLEPSKVPNRPPHS